VTIVRIDNDEATELLLAHLREQGDLSVERAGPGRLRVSILGSYAADAMKLELYLRLRAWEAAERARGNDVRLELEDD
jgi:hypothetical protein